MMNDYLVRTWEKDDCYRTFDEGTQVVRYYIRPLGPMEKNEMSDTIYHAGAEVPYHEHSRGYETFTLAKGTAEAIVRGKKFIMEEGDMLHLPPYMSHGFKHLEEGNIWREVFQEINMVQGVTNKNIVKGSYDGLYDDPEFIKMYRAANKSIIRETPVPEEVDKSEMPEIRTPDFAYSTFRYDGVILRLKVGRWECNGVKEIWHAAMDKGYTVRYDDPHPEWELYYITKGKVHFNILGEEFDAVPGCLVHIPPYHRHYMKAVEDGTELFDMGCPIFLLDLLEDLKAVRINAPEKYADKEFVKGLMLRFNCHATFAGME